MADNPLVEQLGEHVLNSAPFSRESSGTTSVQADTLTKNCDEENIESRGIQTPEDTPRNNSGVCDEEILEVQSISHAEKLGQETVIATTTQGDENYLPETHLSTDAPSEPCWYCLRSLDSESHPEVTKQEEDSDSESTLPSSGQKVNYQTDPRPHFGVACSFHSTCRPLWGSEGPCWGQRNQEIADQTDTCPHCHLGLPPDTLRWHEAKCLLFDGLRSSKKEN